MKYKKSCLVIFVCLLQGVALEVPLGAVELPCREVSSTVPELASNYLLGYEWRQDADGTLYGPYAGLEFHRTLYLNFTADLDIRMFKPASSDDAAGLFLEAASLAYVGPWVSVAAGRRDLGNFLGPGFFFGAYATMGERQLDSASITLPFQLFGGIPDSDVQVRAPYNALSFLYVPNLFEADQSIFDGRQGLVLAQLRVKVRTGPGYSNLALNYAYGLDDYFVNASLDEAGTVDVSYALRVGYFRLFGDYAMQNLDQGSGTSVVAAGLSTEISKWTFGLLNNLAVEGQYPLGDDLANPFTGGDPEDPNLAQKPQPCWFFELSKSLPDFRDGEPCLFYGVAFTNSVGDYTLARLSQGRISEQIGAGFGQGFKVEGLSLRSVNYFVPSGIVYVGYEL